ncbi:fumarylacetoacetate hydrolase family protein [Aquabacter sp. P-9]|uniref:fumarylacetoacetate hydrolase family protein n=1 Tax=Aquabacter sediminis TaxID=3029197 RepID=UPI00237E8025|nr:fumarylacetoacetate hydrolase family protein [Aquabacter sp. P-9]MDE1570175.1 fumarylacetoacetate hydrolase family protein [Aquabacter sp. P-9]
MKLVSFKAGDTAGFGVVKGDAIVDLTGHFSARGITGLRTLIAADALDEARAVAESAAPSLKLADVALLPVIPDPGKIICIGLNYRDHVAETGRTVTENPALFSRYPESQVGHLQPIVKPLESDNFDYEGELALVIGRGGRRIREEDALAAIAGYSCYNEGSIRDYQRHTSQFLAGKTFANTGAFGPWLVTTDEIPDPSRLTLETRLNGQVVQHSTTDLLITDIPALIRYCSTVLTLEPGDVIVTGTPGGVGAKRTPPLWMKPGDTVEVEISGIGILRNPVIDEAA